MRTIYKYTLEPVDFQQIEIPGKLLSVINQREQIVVYALVDTDSTPVLYNFLLVGTDNPTIERIGEWQFLGTASLMSGNLILHVFYQ